MFKVKLSVAGVLINLLSVTVAASRIDLLLQQSGNPDTVLFQTVIRRYDNNKTNSAAAHGSVAVAALRTGHVRFADFLLDRLAPSVNRREVTAHILCKIFLNNYRAAAGLLKKHRAVYQSSPEIYQGLNCLLLESGADWDQLDKLASSGNHTAPEWQRFFLFYSAVANENLQRYPYAKVIYSKLAKCTTNGDPLHRMALIKSSRWYLFNGNDVKSRRADLRLPGFGRQFLAAVDAHLRFFPDDDLIRLHTAAELLQVDRSGAGVLILRYLPEGRVAKVAAAERRRFILYRGLGLFADGSYRELRQMLDPLKSTIADPPLENLRQTLRLSADAALNSGKLPDKVIQQIIALSDGWKAPVLFRFWMERLIKEERFLQAYKLSGIYLRKFSDSARARIYRMQARVLTQPVDKWFLDFWNLNWVMLDLKKRSQQLEKFYDRYALQAVKIFRKKLSSISGFSQLLWLVLGLKQLNDAKLVKAVGLYHRFQKPDAVGYHIAMAAGKAKRYRIALEYFPSFNGDMAGSAYLPLLAGRLMLGINRNVAAEYYYRRALQLAQSSKVKRIAQKFIYSLRNARLKQGNGRKN